jgi:hypothetical protein
MKEDNARFVWTCWGCVPICKVFSVTQLMFALDNLATVLLASHGPDCAAGGAA